MRKGNLVKNGVLIIGGTSLIFSGITMMEQVEHIFHGLQLIITGASLLVLNKYVECK